MSTGRGKKLSLEDRILWARVARTADPLPGRSAEDDVDLATGAGGMPGAGSPQDPTPREGLPAYVAPAQSLRTPQNRRIDAPVRNKLARGRLPIEGRIDLHGLSQGEAHGLLLAFLHRAHAEGRRHLLVVTGKGSSPGSEGVLRRVVPAWFATPAFRGLVHSHADAARRHGGSGALYVTLRRRASEP